MLTTEPVDETFFDTAPFRMSDTFEIARPASQVWAELTGPDTLGWCRIVKDVTWNSPPPFGVGSTRTVRVLGGVGVMGERYFRWDEGRRKSFYAAEMTLPLFRRFAEDYLLEPTSDTSARLTWTIATEPRPAARPGNPVNRLLFGSLFRDTRKHFGLAR
jgi:Polyketide cyclase / dehydrase and lipid transport